MFSVPFVVIFGFIKSFFGSILTNIKVWALIAIVALVGYGLYKYDDIHTKARTLQKEVNEATAANRVLSNTISSLAAESKQKDTTIRLMAEDRQRQLELIKRLSDKNIKIQGTVDQLKKSLDTIKTPPTTEVGPYLKKALKDAQTIRDTQ